MLMSQWAFSQTQGEISAFVFGNANTRDNYESVHDIKKAHQIATGKGVKVGIIGTYFGLDKHTELFSGGQDFTGSLKDLSTIEEHGYWMALTLREIAPDTEIYALNARSRDKALEAGAIVKAIDWAIENDIDILTYSAESFREEHRPMIDKAVQKAIDHNIVTTFLHYSSKENILPFGLVEYRDYYSRQPDIRVLHYDFNLLLTMTYKRYLASERKPKNGNEEPYFSFSSMSTVLAGAIALMKQVNNTLTPGEYRQLLKESSREFVFEEQHYKNVLDIASAVKAIGNR